MESELDDSIGNKIISLPIKCFGYYAKDNILKAVKTVDCSVIEIKENFQFDHEDIPEIYNEYQIRDEFGVFYRFDFVLSKDSLSKIQVHQDRIKEMKNNHKQQIN